MTGEGEIRQVYLLLVSKQSGPHETDEKKESFPKKVRDDFVFQLSLMLTVIFTHHSTTSSLSAGILGSRD